MILDFLFPRKCFSCQKTGGWLCRRCLAKTNPRQEQYCPGCRRPSLSGATHPWCRRKTALDGNLALFAYRPPLKQIMKTYKYQLARQLSAVWQILAKKGLERRKELVEHWQEERFVIVPIPLFSARLRWRGFNQAQAIGKQISRQVKLPLETRLVIRRQWTQPQANLGRQARKSNLSRAFALRAETDLGSRNFIVFDDILTTGQTIKAVGRVLKENGAGKVWGLAMLG